MSRYKQKTNKLRAKEKMFVSVVIPTCNRYSALLENITNIGNQRNVNFEIFVCDDSPVESVKLNADKIEQIKAIPNVTYSYTALFDCEGKKTYGLARARNEGAINASSDVLIFLDDRITPNNENLFYVFAKSVLDSKNNKVWFFGDKGEHKTVFVENCSAVLKKNFIDAGMFCEHINQYGAMTKEIFTRCSRQGFDFIYLPTALAKPLYCKSHISKEEKRNSADEMQSFLKKMGFR